MTSPAPRPYDDYFGYLLDDALPGGQGIAVVLNVYFDESKQLGKSSIFCVAGYLFWAPQARKFSKEWRAHLVKAGVPYFHMEEFAHRTKGSPFENMAEEARRRLLDGLLTTILSRAISHIMVIVGPEEYELCTTPEWRRAHGNAYTFVVRWCLELVGKWAEENDYTGKIAYFFESGGGAGPAWTSYMNRVSKKHFWRDQFRYGSHTFAEKKLVLPLQAADLLAYEATKHYKDTYSLPPGNRRKARYPFERLFETPANHNQNHYLEGASLAQTILLVELFDRI